LKVFKLEFNFRQRELFKKFGERIFFQSKNEKLTELFKIIHFLINIYPYE
jgi:hypothetical protein